MGDWCELAPRPYRHDELHRITLGPFAKSAPRDSLTYRATNARRGRDHRPYLANGFGMERPLFFSATMNSRKRRPSEELGFQCE